MIEQSLLNFDLYIDVIEQYIFKSKNKIKLKAPNLNFLDYFTYFSHFHRNGPFYRLIILCLLIM